MLSKRNQYLVFLIGTKKKETKEQEKEGEGYRIESMKENDRKNRRETVFSSFWLKNQYWTKNRYQVILKILETNLN